ncbi:coiled-coil domain-containing protein [Paenibacillus lactis]|uniref:coiled-coil domain-containing protein n=1 Tax=Paenibacillus lactis TaxID=228574 RepID=UPI003D71AD91
MRTAKEVKNIKKQRPDKVSLKSRALELNSQSNDVYMELTMCILTDKPNLNNLKFNENYIKGIVANKEKFIGIPLVVNRTKLESGFYSNLNHELDKSTNLLKTDTIGSFVDFREEVDKDGTLMLMGDARIYKRYPTVCESILELYESGDLEFSCEAMVYGYESIDEESGIRCVDYEYEGKINSLFGSCIVSDPAEIRSKPTLLIAEALKIDLGESEMSIKEEIFNKNIEIKYHGKFELSSLKFSEVSNQIYNILNPINPRSHYRTYNYYIQDLYTDFVIVEDSDDYHLLYKIKYRIENDIVILDERENWVEGYKGFIPKGVDIDQLLLENEKLSQAASKATKELNSNHEKEKLLMEEEVQQLNEKIKALEAKVVELNETVVSKQEEINGLQEKHVELSNTIKELEPYKAKVEMAEKEQKMNALRTKYTKILSEETMKSEEVQTAISELNSVKLNEIAVSELVNKNHGTDQEQPSGDVIVAASSQQDLLPQSAKERLYAPRN